MDFLVAFHGGVDGLFVAGEGGGIEDDEVVFLFALFAMAKVVEGVAGFGGEGEAVEFGIALGGVGGFLGDVDGGDGFGSGLGAGESEAALVAEHVEDGGVFGEACDGGIGVGDVEVEAGLLGVGEVELELESLHGHFDGAGVFAVEDGGFGFESFGGAHGGVVAQDDGVGGRRLV